MAITAGQVTRFLRDFPELNILLDNVQFDDEDIREAMKFAIDEYNVMTPITSVTVDNFPNDWILLMGTAAHLLLSESFLQLRNDVAYTDGDIQTAGLDNKAERYKALSDNLRTSWTTAAQRLKIQQNMESCYGSLASGYRNLRTGYKDW